jgi:hypothetical protein
MQMGLQPEQVRSIASFHGGRRLLACGDPPQLVTWCGERNVHSHDESCTTAFGGLVVGLPQPQMTLGLDFLFFQVVLHGLPIRPAFSKRQPPRRKLRKQLGLRRDEPAVFLVGGGEGMGPVERTVDSIAAGPGPRVQLVVVCGRNAKLVKRLSEKVRSLHHLYNTLLRRAVWSMKGPYYARVAVRRTPMRRMLSCCIVAAFESTRQGIVWSNFSLLAQLTANVVVCGMCRPTRRACT